jgi:hypothetical protein
VINLLFNTFKPLSIVSERTVKNKRLQEDDRCGKVIYFELFGENCMEIIATGPIFDSHYEL